MNSHGLLTRYDTSPKNGESGHLVLNSNSLRRAVYRRQSLQRVSGRLLTHPKKTHKQGFDTLPP